MSNLHPYGGAKNAPWAQAGAGNNMAQANRIMVPFQQQQQQQVFQTMSGLQQQQQQQNINLGLQQMSSLGAGAMFQQVGTVSYPNPRALNPNAFQTGGLPNVPVQNSQVNTSTKQRVFTGTVTKIHDNFGFVDEDVFFQVDACVKGSNPGVGDRVLVEATYNLHMPFKWNATRIQVLPKTGPSSNNNRNSMGGKSGGNSGNYNSNSNSYNAVPPPSDNSNGNHFGSGTGGGRNQNRNKQGSGGGSNRLMRDRSPIRERGSGVSDNTLNQRNADDENERKRRREERMREREKEEKKSPVRRRSRSPKRRRARVVPRYMVQIPKIALDMKYADVLEARRRYNNLYIPSDFFSAQIRWIDAFPADKQFTLTKPCSFIVMNKDVDVVNENDAILEPSDADYAFSAKVMLMSVPGMEEIYQRSCALAEDKDKPSSSSSRHHRSTSDSSATANDTNSSGSSDHVHPTRLINFLVGVRGKNETMAIGGPWSKSLDGSNPATDPSVLIRTAVRCCKALTGIDLSHCTKWYRFVELYYRRTSSRQSGSGGGAADSARVETVVVFLPDVWSCLPTRLEWDTLHTRYREQLELRLQPKPHQVQQQQQQSPTAVTSTSAPEVAVASANSAGSGGVEVAVNKVPGAQPTSDEQDGEGNGESFGDPTHYSDLEPKSMNVAELRQELKSRGISSKGLKSQLVARLSKALKSEQDKEENDEDMEQECAGDEDLENLTILDDTLCVIDDEADDAIKEVVEEKKLDEKEKALLEKRYTLPETQHIIVHPSRTAKSGKFDCLVMSLSVLLDYRPEDTKEHSFEVSLFAELFNEMLMRDFGFNIYKTLNELPDVVKPKEEKKDKDKDKRKDDDKKDEKDKKDSSASKNDDKDKKKDKKDKEKDDKRSERGESDESDDDDDKKSKGKKKDRVKMYTKDRNLLLSFIYFDQTHCGYIFEKDIEDLLYTLGLSLSRGQVRRLVGKVITRDSLHYRKLTDKPKEDDFIVIDDSEKDADISNLAAGNKQLLPVFQEYAPTEKKRKLDSSGSSEKNENKDSDLVMYRGALVDVAKLQLQLERSDKARLDAESRMVDLKAENVKLSERYSKSGSTIKQLTSETKDAKEKLRNSEDILHRTAACSKLFKTTLMEIRDKIDPVLNSTTNKDDAKKESDKDRKDETKSRWEKEKEKKVTSPNTDTTIKGEKEGKEVKIKAENSAD